VYYLSYGQCFHRPEGRMVMLSGTQGRPRLICDEGQDRLFSFDLGTKIPDPKPAGPVSRGGTRITARIHTRPYLFRVHARTSSAYTTVTFSSAYTTVPFSSVYTRVHTRVHAHAHSPEESTILTPLGLISSPPSPFLAKGRGRENPNPNLANSLSPLPFLH
jgi:hypothetical protein